MIEIHWPFRCPIPERARGEFLPVSDRLPRRCPQAHRNLSTLRSSTKIPLIQRLQSRMRGTGTFVFRLFYADGSLHYLETQEGFSNDDLIAIVEDLGVTGQQAPAAVHISTIGRAEVFDKI